MVPQVAELKNIGVILLLTITRVIVLVKAIRTSRAQELTAGDARCQSPPSPVFLVALIPHRRKRSLACNAVVFMVINFYFL